MKITIPIAKDSHNTEPTGYIEFYEGERYVHLVIDGRDIGVTKENFKWIGILANRLTPETK